MHSFHLAGQLLFCHQEPSNLQMLKILQWPLACASIQTEPLLVTLLLPERAKSAFTSLLSHSSVLHLTTVQNKSFLNPKSWTSQADDTRTWRSGTDVVLVGDQKGYDTYCTADTCNMCNAQLGIALHTPGVANHSIRSGPRPCRQQSQDDSIRAKSFEKDTRSQGSDTAHPMETMWPCNEHDPSHAKPYVYQRLTGCQLNLWYTYGSKQSRDDGVNVIGIYSAARRTSHSINPRWSGATNTITRAKLAAIASTLLLMG